MPKRGRGMGWGDGGGGTNKKIWIFPGKGSHGGIPKNHS